MIAWNFDYRFRMIIYALLVVLFTMACPAVGFAIPLLSSLPVPLTENNLNGATLNITLTPGDGQFSVVTAASSAFVLHNAPANTIVSSATINTATSASLVVHYDGTIFTNDISNFSVSLDSSIVSPATIITSSGLSIFTTHGIPALTATPSAPLQEATLDGSTIALVLNHEQFKDALLSRSNFVLNNAPPGVSVGGVVYAGITGATLIIDSNGTDFFTDYTNVSVVVSGAELLAANPLTSNTFSILTDTNSNNANLTNILADGVGLQNFSAATTAYNYSLIAGATAAPVITAATQDPNAHAVITQASGINGTQANRTATIVVTAQNGTTQKTYTVTFSRTPYILATVPANNAANVNENAVYSRTINNQTYYFLQVVFADPDGTLQSSASLLDLLRTSMIYADGGSRSSLVDRDLLSYISGLEDPSAFISQYIMVSGTGSKTLYIPIRKLGTNIKYLVELNAGLVQYPDGAASPQIDWSFTTMPVPSFTSVSIGSVSEDYDETIPIILEGSAFNADVSVYFNTTAAYRVKVKTRSNGTEYLEVYLPRGSKRLEPGIYSIKVKNGTDHEVIVQGSFCVVASSALPAPANGQRITSEDYLGTVIENSLASETILQLSSSYANAGSLEIDLDNLMGTDVLTRKMVFPAGSWSNINALMTYSQWADVALYGFRSDTTGTDRQAYVTIGRATYTQAASLRSKLGNYSIKSDFFNVGGEFYTVDSVEIHLPYRLSTGSSLRMMRYDPSSRSFKEIPAVIDASTATIIAGHIQPGIFVAVE